ncbi:hypothetical protein O181_024571 [Austropuccinia psidii MF-1]|uniref:Uncharacterized protein n=1 Tax=Austropuccinia psidii MF-1 TaxID=1389203 RepID=A0A9Q3GYR3_9BASI|nr:hypothetical protein [Austropuccinia psidii MF-1]
MVRGLVLQSAASFFFPILTLEVNELNLPPFVEPSQHNEPPVCTPTQPILGPSELPQTGNNSTHDPEPEVALTQSMDYPFGKSNFSLKLPFPAFQNLQLIPPLPTLSSSLIICWSDPPPPCARHPSIPQCGSAGIHLLETHSHDPLSNGTQIDQPSFVGSLPISPHDSLCGFHPSK